MKVFEELGARVEQKNPGFDDVEPVFRTHWFSGAAFLLKDFSAEKRKLVAPDLLEVAKEGAKITAAELLDAQMKRGALGTLMNLFHRDYDLLVTPTLSLPAFDRRRISAACSARLRERAAAALPGLARRFRAAAASGAFRRRGGRRCACGPDFRGAPARWT